MNLSATRKRIVIVGATSLIAEHCARLWANAAPIDLVLVGRDLAKLERIAGDLRVRSPESDIRTLRAELTELESIGRLVNQLASGATFDVALIAYGSLPEQSACQLDIGLCHEGLVVNGLSPVLFAEAFAGYMEKTGSGSLVMIGSVAGDRGRKSNYVYGAAKGLVERYAQGLQHRMAASSVQVVLVKPGPTDTPMTAHLKARGVRLADAGEVAKQIVRGVERGRPVVYVPAEWGVIMWIIRHLPRAIFNRLDI